MPKKPSKKAIAPKTMKRRKSARKKAVTSQRPVASKPKAKPAAIGGEHDVGDLRHQFVAIAMRLGAEEAQRLLDRVVDVQTPTTR